MLLECSRWQALRADILAQYINIYRVQVAKKPPILHASISMRYLDPTVRYVNTKLTTAKFLNAMALLRHLVLKSYPKLAKAYLPAIENNFFRFPLTDKERKGANFSCPKSSTMKYLPPSVNDQLQLQQKEVLLSDLATTILQLRKSTVYREMNFAEKPPKISEPDTESLSETEVFNALSFSDGGFVQAQQTQATAPAAQSNNNPAGLWQSQMESVDFYSGSPVGECESEYREAKSFLEEKISSILSRKASTEIRYVFLLTIHSHCYKMKLDLEANKVQTDKNFALLTAAVFCSSKENRETQTSPQIEEAESTSRGNKLKNGDIANNMTNTTWGIVSGFCFYSGLWAPLKALMYINPKDLFTILYALQLHIVVGCPVLIYSDNTTAFSYVRKFGI
ncbi:hypothetical protein BB561_006816 [Smittium simulii]|uniref:Uncharacterized protein n=1 Tax=Smittium simulii TaxID=133385 RepID=A0A2T9Y1C5_9FUNG|nr:hypothetical protein BB561_006816 [Smittium simulii]